MVGKMSLEQVEVGPVFILKISSVDHPFEIKITNDTHGVIWGMSDLTYTIAVEFEMITTTVCRSDVDLYTLFQ